jgi:hypothetical protein
MQINSKAQQTQGWVKMHVEGDEFSGTLPNTTYMYTASDGSTFYLLHYDKGYYSDIMVETESGIFDYNSLSGSKVVAGKIGLFDEKNNLIKEWGNRSFYVGKENKSANPVRRLSGKILEHLIDNEGYVRIIVKKYSDKSLDIRIPCLNPDEVLNLDELTAITTE